MRISRPKIDKGAGEAVVAYDVAPCFFPTHFQGAPTIKTSDRKRDDALDEIRIKHGGEGRGKKILAQDLVRCGLGSLTYVDFDVVSATNPARQDFNSTDLGQSKVEALAAALHRINPDVEVNYLLRDFCEIGREEFDLHLGHTNLFICATDFFPAQARGNLEAIRLLKPAIWIGLYRGGRAGDGRVHSRASADPPPHRLGTPAQLRRPRRC